jgi:hypothetical protein
LKIELRRILVADLGDLAYRESRFVLIKNIHGSALSKS